MDELTYDTSATPLVVIERVGGDLRVMGWEENSVHAESGDEDTLSLDGQDNGGQVNVQADSDCSLHVPRQANLRINQVGGDAKVKNVEGTLEIKFVGGDLILRQVGPTEIQRLGGDLNVKRVNGDLVFNTGGDASARNVSRDVKGNAGADLYLRDIGGSVQASAGSDAVLSTGFNAGKTYEVKAGSDVLCRLTPGASAKVSIRCGSEITVDVLGATIEGNSRQKTVTIGDGAAQVSLIAGSDVTLASIASDPDSMGDFGDSFGNDFGLMAEEFAAQIESQIETQMSQIEKQLNERLSKMEFQGAGINAEDIVARVKADLERAADAARRKSANIRTRLEDKVEAAERRAERAAERAERHAGHPGHGDKRRKTGAFVFKFDGPRPPVPPRPPTPPRAPQPPTPPVSDEERMAVLKMLEQGKISVEQAEKLLAALEGADK
jgi:hypothetical protein